MTTTDNTITITTPKWAAKQEAKVLFNIAVKLLSQDVGALTSDGDAATLIRLCCKLVEIDYEDAYYAAIELANHERDVRNKNWTNRIGLTKFKREDFDRNAPHFDKIEEALRGF